MPAAEILTIPLPPEGLSAREYRTLEKALKDWETEVRGNIKRYPARSYNLGVEQTLAFLKMLGHADVLPAGRWGPTKRVATRWQQTYTLHEVDGALAQYVDQIRSAVLYGLQGSADPAQVASWLYKATSDAKVNWRTIARTEMVRANAAGRLDAIQQMGYTQVWAPSHTGACPACRRLLENQVFDLDDVKNATNYGRKQQDWIAAIPLHPHCRHVWLPHVPAVFNEAQRGYASLAERGLDDETLNEMFDSSGQVKPRYVNDPRLLAYFEETGKTVDPLEFVLGTAIAKTARTEPPGLHHTSSRGRACRTCEFFDGRECRRHNWQVDAGEICADWEPVQNVGKGYFDNPQAGLDPLIWDERERLRPDVRQRIVSWWRDIFTNDAPLWSRLYLTGSACSRAWGGKRTPSDVDVQVIVDYQALREYRPAYASLSDPELHAALVTQLRASLNDVEIAPGFDLDAFVRPERTAEEFEKHVALSGQGCWDVRRGRWVLPPPVVPEAEDPIDGNILEGDGGEMALEHPDWIVQARRLRDLLQHALDTRDRAQLQEAYTFVHDLRASAFATGDGQHSLGQFLWQFLMSYGPLARVKHLLNETEMGKVWPDYRWSTDVVAKDRPGVDAGVEHWVRIHPLGEDGPSHLVLVRNSDDGKHMIVIGGAGGHLNGLRIERGKQMKAPEKDKPAKKQHPVGKARCWRRLLGRDQPTKDEDPDA